MVLMLMLVVTLLLMMPYLMVFIHRIALHLINVSVIHPGSVQVDFDT